VILPISPAILTSHRFVVPEGAVTQLRRLRPEHANSPGDRVGRARLQPLRPGFLDRGAV